MSQAMPRLAKTTAAKPEKTTSPLLVDLFMMGLTALIGICIATVRLCGFAFSEHERQSFKRF
jgi:hypothetical protein